MGKLGIAGLALMAGLLAPKPSKAILTYEDLDRPRPITAIGPCIYKKYIFQMDCYEGRGCQYLSVTDLQGNPTSLPEDFCLPRVAFRRGAVLYCLDPRPEQCDIPPPPENKCEEKPTISLDCLCC